MLKKKIVGILLVSLLVGTIFAGCVEKEEKKIVKPEEIRIKPEEIIKGIEGATIQKVGESRDYAICNIEFIGEKEARIKGTLFIPFKPNGAGIIALNPIGARKEIEVAKFFGQNGYISLACCHRGSWDSKGYISAKYWPIDTSQQVGILEEILVNLNVQRKSLLGKGRIVLYGHDAAGNIAMETATIDPRVDALIVSGFIQDGFHSTFRSVTSFLKNPSFTSQATTGVLQGLHIFPLSSKTFPAVLNYGIYLLSSASHSGFKYAEEIEIPILYIYPEYGIRAPPKWSEKAYELTPAKEKDIVCISGVSDGYLTPEGYPVTFEVLDKAIDWTNAQLVGGGKR